MNVDAVSKLASAHPKASGFVYRYGTAGFRERATVLDSVLVRLGQLSWLRALSTSSAVGLMVTASHNLVADNGVKLVDPDGGMLSQSWEAFATELCNAEAGDVAELLQKHCDSLGIDLDLAAGAQAGAGAGAGAGAAKVFVGRDTRPHSARLAELALDGIASLGGAAASVDVGVVTTPMLHHCVRSSNLPAEAHLATVDGYYTKVSQAFHALVAGAAFRSPLIVDAAYGVGGPRFMDLMAVVSAGAPSPASSPTADLRNSPTGAAERAEEEAALLNNGVGAEHVQKRLLLPEKTLALPAEAGVRCCSFDGDADRIVYFRASPEGKLTLVDGDKLACAYTAFIQKQLALLPAAATAGVTLACIQTAYANGASTRYIEQTLKVLAPRTKTGVKHLHHRALDFDIACYFEANGHGTVLFKPTLVARIKGADVGPDSAARRAQTCLLALEQLINQATGDAMADMLALEAIMAVEGTGLDEVVGMYTDLPSRQLKCTVADRTAIVTSDDESQVLEPAALQTAIDAAVAGFECGRAFARPSGTEDAVRVYAEAKTPEQADELALAVLRAVFDNAGGVGDRP